MTVAVQSLPALTVATVLVANALLAPPPASEQTIRPDWDHNQVPRVDRRILRERRSPSHDALVTAAIGQAQDELEGCFTEWNEREPGDADLLVRMTVDADGVAHSSTTAAGPDSPFLRLCVSESIGRVRFASGSDDRDVEVFVHWSDKQVLVASRITGRRRPDGMDLTP